MTSLTTLFVVGVEEYVEFNESMGSKAFVEHIWDQSKTPLKLEDTSASGSQLHSAGARISSDPPPRIEFPTIVRQKGRGNRYKATGRYISWEELKRRNPVALKDPPSLEEFIRKGSQVGTAERLAPGAFLKGEKKFKITKKPKDIIDLHQSQDGWIGGSSESSYASEAPATSSSSSSTSIYAPKPSSNGSSGSIYAPKPSVGSSGSIYATKTSIEPTTTIQESNAFLQNPSALKSDGQETASRTLRKSRSGLSLSARLGIDPSAKESENQPEVPAIPQKQESTRRPSKLTLPDNRMTIVPDQNQNVSAATDLKTPVARTPLSASHPVPETPLKHHGNRHHIDIPPTPNTEQRVSENEMQNLPKAGLMLDPGQSIPSQSGVQTSRKSTPLRAARSQMDDMLARLRQARSGFAGGGSGQSMWAPKTATEEVPIASTKDESSGKATPTLASVAAEVADSDPELTPKLGASKTPERAKEGAKSKAQKADLAAQPKELMNGKSLLNRLGPKVEETNAPIKANTTALPAKSQEKKDAQEKKGATSSAGKVENVEKIEGNSKPLQLDDTLRSAPKEPKAEREKKEVANDVIPVPDLPSSETEVTSQIDDDDASQTKDVVESQEEIYDTASQAGNDTMTSINWADDDDDDSLPELTEEWMKTALLSPPPSSKKPTKADSSSVASDDISSRHDVNERPSHPQRGERKGRGSKREKVTGPPRSTKNAPVDLGIRIAGSAGKERSASAFNENTDLSSVPPWQRRTKAASSPPSDAPLGLRIAGQAETKAKEANKKPANVTPDSKGRRNIHAQDQAGDRRSKQAPVQNRRWGNGSVLPPNATPLQMPDNPFVVDASPHSTDNKTRSKGRGGRIDHR